MSLESRFVHEALGVLVDDDALFIVRDEMLGRRLKEHLDVAIVLHTVLIHGEHALVSTHARGRGIWYFTCDSEPSTLL